MKMKMNIYLLAIIGLTLSLNSIAQPYVIDPQMPAWNLGFGVNGDPNRFLSIDVVNSAVDSDPLELIYSRGSGVIVGNTGQNKLLKVNGSFQVIDYLTPSWGLGFGVNGDPAKFLSVDVVNSSIDSDPLELVYSRGSGVIIGNTGQNKLLKVNGSFQVIDYQTPSWGLGFGVNGDPAKFLSVDVVNSAVDNDPLELVYNRGSGVIIGTTGQNKYLKVNGNVAVFGKLESKEVKVNLDPSTVPDYVFEENYKLRTLEETKKYIAQNKHLPEIPSADEIGENGIDIGEMNMMLLKKIEELTLYQIQLMERLELVEATNKEMEKKLQTLKE